MFDPIKAPPNEYLPPATGHGTEFGDSWHTAVGKINAGFAKVMAALKGDTKVATEAVDADARKAFDALKTAHDAAMAHISHLESVLSELLFKHDALEQKVFTLIHAAPAEPPPMRAAGTNAEDALAAVAGALNVPAA